MVGADITQFRKSMRDIRDDVGVLSGVIGGVSGAARTMTYAFTAPMVALGTYAVQAASSFDASMRNINSIAHLPDAQFNALSKQVLDFGKNTRSGTQAAADALYEIYSAGLTGQAAFDLMAQSTKMAEAGLSDLSLTTNALTATVMAFSSQNLTAAHASDIWTAMVQQGVGSLSDFMANSQKVAPLANMLGISFENIGANAAFMSQQGGGAKKAMTSLAMAMSNIIKPNETMKESFKKLGVTTGKELIDKFGTLEVAIQALKKVAGNDVDFAAMFSKTGLEYASTVANNVDKVTDSVKKFHGLINGATESAWNEQMKSFAAVWDKLQVALQSVAIVIGQKIIPIITPMIEGFTKTLLAITDVNPEIIMMGVAFTGVIAAAAPLVWLLTSMINPVGLVIGAITALGTAFATNFMGARDTVTRVVGQILGDVQPMIDLFNDFWSKVFPSPPTVTDITGSNPLHIQSDDVIVVDKPMSLWDLYVSKGYDKQFSWTEFMKKAKEGGWDGKGLDIGDKIRLPDSGKLSLASKGLNLLSDAMKNVYAHYVNQNSNYDPLSGKMVEKQVTFWDRIAQAATDAWPKLKVELDKIWTNIKNWVTGTAIPELDRFGGSVMASIAGWFNPTARGGKTEAYNAVKDLVGGGASRGITDGVSKLSQTFPEISAALKGMIDSMGAWIETEGLPTIARSLGYFVGSIGATIGQLLSGIGNSIMGGDGASAAKGLLEGFDKSVMTPALQGINDAMKDKGVKSDKDGFFSGLVGVLVAGAGMSVFGKLLTGQGFGSAIFSTIGTVINAAKSTVTVGASILLKIGNSLLNTSVGAGLANGATNFASRVMAAITDKIDYQIKLPLMMKWDSLTTSIGNSLSTAFSTVTGWASGVGSAIWAAIAPAIGLAAATAGLLLGTIIILGTAGILFSPSFREKFSVALRGVVEGAVDTIFGEGTWDKAQKNFETGGYKVAAAAARAMGDEMKAQQIEKLFTPDPVKLRTFTGASIEENAKEPFFFSPELIAQNPEINFAQPPRVSLEALNVKWDKLVASGQMTPENEAAMIRGIQEMMMNPDIESNFNKGYRMYLDTLNLEPAGIKVDTSKAATADRKDNDLLSAIGMTPEAIKEGSKPVNEEIKTSISTFGATVLANIGDGGSLDSNRIITSFLQPLEDHWNTMFAATGTMATNFQAFTTTFGTGLGGMVTQMAIWTLAATVGNTLVSNSFNVYNGIKDKLVSVNAEAKKLSDTLNSLVTHSPYEINITVKTDGTVPAVPNTSGASPNGSNATGLNYVPYDGYMAKLHQGEMVLDKQDANSFKGIPSMMNDIIKSGTGQRQETNQDVQINVYGVQDTDTLIRELERRGYKLGR